MTKYIILAYANDEKESLKWLEDENNAINKYFLKHNEGDVTAIPLHEANIEQLREGIENRYDDIVILHFSGHSDSNRLYLKNQDVWVEGIAGFAAMMNKNLQLVFLNGCANKEQVAAFHKAGVKAVIATARSVNDEMASLFSKAFYSGLCKHMTLGRAFDQAVSEVKARSVSINFLSQPRHLKGKSLPDKDPKEGFPWGIYYNDDFKNVDLWTLPQIDISPHINVEGYKPMNQLVKNIAAHASPYYENIKKTEGEMTIDQTIRDEFESLKNFYLDKFKDTEHDRKKLAGIVKNMLPFPVAARFERMLRTAADMQRSGNASSASYRSLITAQFEFYYAMTKLCGLTMMSELYEFLLKPGLKPVKITKDQYAIIDQFFHVKEPTKREFDFAALIKSIREVLESNDCSLFIREYLSPSEGDEKSFKDHLAPNGEIFEAHVEISSIRDQFAAGTITDAYVVPYAKRMEDLLWRVLKKVYFIMRYKLASIKRIEIIKYRFSPVLYSHNMIILHRALYGYETDEAPDFEPGELATETKHTDSHSVLLFRGLKDVTGVLNITPFVIDINMLKGNEEFSLLYMYSHFNENGKVVFEEVQSQRDQIELDFDETKGEDEKLQYVAHDVKMVPSEKRNLTAKLRVIDDQYSELRIRLKSIDPLK